MIELNGFVDDQIYKPVIDTMKNSYLKSSLSCTKKRLEKERRLEDFVRVNNIVPRVMYDWLMDI